MTTEQKHTITIPGLPEGWRAVAYRLGKAGEYFFCATYKEVMILKEDTELTLVLIVEKIKPRRVVLEDTGEVRQPKEGEYVFNNGNLCLCRKPERWGNEHHIWRVVEEE